MNSWSFGIWIGVVLLVCGSGYGFDIGQHMATKTAYPAPNASVVYTKVPPQCTLFHQEYVARHGSRYPTQGDVTRMNDLQHFLQQHRSYYNPAFAWMGSWKNPFESLAPGQLSFTGEEEHYHIAKRMLSQYSEVLNQSYVPSHAFIQTTQVPRASRSGNVFAFGILEGRGQIGGSQVAYEPWYQYSESMSIDTTLRFFDVCPAYHTQVLNNISTNKEYDLWTAKYNPSIAQQITQMISNDPSTFSIQPEDVNTMWSMCAYEIAVFDEYNQFCTLFDQNSSLILEYGKDLQIYYQKGYGTELGYNISARLLQDFINRTEYAIHQFDQTLHHTRSTPPYQMLNTTLKYCFAHAETMIPFECLLGLYKDDYQLTADLDPDLIARRKFRTSVVSPFATNFLLNSYHCDNGDGSTSYLIKALHNERELVLPGCSSVYCAFDQFREHYNDQYQLKYTQLCEEHQLPSPTPPPPLGDSKPCIQHGFTVLNWIALVCIGISIVVVMAMVGWFFWQRHQTHQEERTYHLV